jgi:3-hydroxyisobutyrate dehydrogenase-like beta-hydroxyacid dehydrogenase
MKKYIGFIGLGMMGKPMAQRLIDRGHQLVVFNRTKAKADELVKQGANWADNPKSVTEQSDIVISMISTPEVLREIVLGKNGILEGVSEGKTHIDMSTVSPAIINQLNDAYKNKKINFLHAPVLGSVPNVIEGSLLIFVGGDEKIYRSHKEIFEVIGKRIWYFPEHTQATYLKLACNSFIANMIVTLSQGLLLTEKVGISPEVLLEVLNESTLNSIMYQTKGKSIAQENFVPRFITEHIFKDINLVIEAAEKLNLNLPTMPLMKQLFGEAISEGFGKDDYSSVYKILRQRR